MCHMSESRDGVHTVNYLVVTVICPPSIREREIERSREEGREKDGEDIILVSDREYFTTYPCDISSLLSYFIRKQKSLAPVCSVNSWYLNLR